jgi:heat shock protein HtpX
MNTLKTLFLLVLLSGIFLAIGGLVGGTTGLIVAGVFALGMNFFSYWFSDKLALRMSGAREVTRSRTCTASSMRWRRWRGCPSRRST